VQIHSWRPGAVAAKVRAAIPGVKLLVGCGVDGVAKEVAKGRKSVAWGNAQLLQCAQRAADVGALAVVWNAEGAWKRAPNTEEKKRLSHFLTTGLFEVKARYPRLEQWHTSFDHPTYHSAYNWSDWIGKGSPIKVSLPQVYAAPADPKAFAARDGVDRREARALASWAEAVRKGWIAPDAPAGTPEDETDVDWLPYYQAHNVLASDTIDSAVEHPLACLWAYPTRADKHGRNALRALCDLWHRELWGPGAVRALQAQTGAGVDGVYGVKTAKAAGLIDWEL
jgi:hypothetical protein